MFRSFVVATSLLSVGIIASAQEATPPLAEQIEGIVAVVNDDPISFTDVRQRARLLLLSLGGQQPTQEQIQQLTSQALEQLIDEKLQLQEASEYEVEISDAEIANSIESLARQSGITRDDLLNTLIQSGVNPTSLENQTRADIAWRRIMGGLYGTRIRISQTQILDRLSRLKAASSTEQYHISEIFLYAPLAEDKERALTAAASIREQLMAGAPFELAAERFSSAPTAAAGGDMGWVTLADIDQTRAGIIQDLLPPALSNPIITESGIYLMALNAKKEPAELTSMVDLTRLAVASDAEDKLIAAAAAIGSCSEIDAVTDADDEITSTVLTDIKVSELGPEGKNMVMSAEIGGHTEIFAQSGKLVIMFVCRREDDVENLPSKDQVEDRLYAQQLSMISQRSLRNLRRDATIIRR